MLELQGKYATAKVFTDVVDEASISQVISLLNQPYAEGERVRMMPDIHAGAGCTIGTTMTIRDKICPNLVGVDIGCGMETIRIKESHIGWTRLSGRVSPPVSTSAQRLTGSPRALTFRGSAVPKR